jgi:hypothetical protein
MITNDIGMPKRERHRPSKSMLGSTSGRRAIHGIVVEGDRQIEHVARFDALIDDGWLRAMPPTIRRTDCPPAPGPSRRRDQPCPAR